MTPLLLPPLVVRFIYYFKKLDMKTFDEVTWCLVDSEKDREIGHGIGICTHKAKIFSEWFSFSADWHVCI